LRQTSAVIARNLGGLATICAVALSAVPAALAHGPAGGGVGYVSTVDSLRPPVLGVTARVLGGDDRLQLVNYSGKTIVVEGYDGEPFLRFTKSGVYENANSPTTYLSRARDQTGVAVPTYASPGAVPAWRKAVQGSTFTWHDRRIRWTQPGLPPVVKAAPNETHLIFRWHVPAQADAKRFAISGYLGYAPLPKAAAEDGTGPWLVAGVVGATALALVAIGVGARRTRRAP
jgi:hypothetical protein